MIPNQPPSRVPSGAQAGSSPRHPLPAQPGLCLRTQILAFSLHWTLLARRSCRLGRGDGAGWEGLQSGIGGAVTGQDPLFLGLT